MFGRTSIAIAALSGLASLGTTAAPAQANIFRDLDVSIRVGQPAPTRVWVEPVYETRCDRVWVEPVYDTRCDRVWHEATFVDRPTQSWVPDRYETRRERYRDECGRPVVRTVQVLVERGHYVQSCDHVLVRDGYWEDVQQRVVVTAGFWSNVEKRVVVREGYWQENCDPRGGSNVQIDVSKRYDDRRDDRGDDRRYDDDRPSRSRYDRGDRYAGR